MLPEIPDKLTRRDMDILHILWDNGESMTATQIVHADSSLTMNTVQAVLRRLLKEELIEVDKIVYSGTVLSRSFRPVMSEEDFETSLICGKLRKMRKRTSVGAVMTSLLGSVDPSEIKQEEIDKLEAILEEMKRNMQEDQ